ncbi:MAG: DUF2147 domain-containing protein [Steroidobacteraceae bacterium]
MRAIVAVAIGWVGALLCLAPVRAAGPAGSRPGFDPTHAVLGNWLVQSRDGIIQISRAPDGTYQGRIVGGTDPRSLDRKNPDPAKRRNTLKGTLIMTGLKYDGDSRWSAGAIYDPDSGKLYKCSMQLIDQDHLRLRGFFGISLLGRNQVWTRYLGAQMDLTGPVP